MGWGAALLVLAAGGCSSDGASSRGETGAPDTTASSSRDVSGTSYDTARVVVHMGEHFWALADAHDAAIAGDLNGLREAAGTLADHQPAESLPASAEAYMRALLDRSRATAAAQTLAEAGQALSRLAASCGACHEALGAPLPVLIEDQPESEPGLEGSMSSHIRGADLLWDALIGPSSEAWEAGVVLMAATDIAPEEVTESESSRATVANLLQRLGTLSEEAAGAPAAERPELYGALVTTCGECHRALGRGFGRQDPG